MLRSKSFWVLAVTALALAACSEQAEIPIAPSIESAVKLNGTATAAWQEEARTQVAAHNLSPLAAGRVFALLGVAQYAAIVALEEPNDDEGVLPEFGYGPGGRRRFELQRGALAGASAQVLKFFFPNAASAIDQRFQVEQAAAAGEQFGRGLQVGTDVANQLIARAQADHFTDPWTGTVPTGPGKWVNNGTPAGATFGNVTPYLLTTNDQFRPAPPPEFGSADYLAALQEIRTLSDGRTAEQLAIANFWSFPTGTFTPLGYWNQVAGMYSERYRLNERATAHVFALTHAAAYDAQIGCWDAKYYYWFIRPSQADPAITLPIGLPNHPSYPSGHSCNSAAATTVLAHFFPNEQTELEGWLHEAGASRMYAGIHYRFDIDAGKALGISVGQLALDIDQNGGLLSALR
ncbi:MAG TPA: vanadium-dependent haloperoxidase [Longimicrobiales bacterium]|nr:vanadium-dependent haloperoxidase [Longimicrobiales bacterium]